MPSWSTTLHNPAQYLLALLLVGHIGADFLVQTASVAAAKRRRARPMLWHGLLTWITHLVLIFPFLNIGLLAGVTLLAAFHILLDALRARIDPGWNRPLFSFFVDQALHTASILLLWRVVLANEWHLRGILPGDAPWVGIYTRYALVAAGFVFNAKGGTMIVRKLLERYPQIVPNGADHESPQYAMGRTIGCLERFLVFALILLGQWAALGLVIAAKSIARFRELSSQPFADYYLIGTLSSLLVALGSGILARMVLLG